MNQYEYKIEKIEKDTYCLTEYAKTHSYLIVGKNKAMLIDTGCGCGNLLKTVKSITDKELIIVNTHGHLDHIASNGLFNCIYIAKEDENLMHESSSYEFKNIEMRHYLFSIDKDFSEVEMDKINNLPICKNVKYLKDNMIFDLGDRKIEAIYTPGHTNGCYCFLDSSRKQLFSGDTICDISILLFLKDSCSVETYFNSLMKLEEKKEDFNLILPGHHKIFLDKEYLQEYKKCASFILDGTLIGEVHKEHIGTGLKAHYKRAAIVYSENRVK